MIIRLLVILSVVLLVARAPARAETPSPIADHHAHLISPAFAEVVNGEPLPRVAVAPEFKRLLAERARWWNDQSKLADLFNPEAIGFVDDGTRSGLFTGRSVLARFLANRFARPYQLTPVSIAVDSNIAAVSGYYSRGAGGDLQRIGFFNLTLTKRNGSWLIQSEFPTFPTAPKFSPMTAARLIELLDQASISKAAVLSGGAAFGGRYVDIYGERRTQAELHAKVRSENDWVRSEAARYPTRLISFCAIHPLAGYAESELRRCKATGHRGLKLHFLESGVDLSDAGHVAKVRRIFVLANQLRLPMVVHVGNNEGSPESGRLAVQTFFDRLVSAAPNVPIQVAHLWGGGAFSQPALSAYADRMATRSPDTRNVYFDMSEAPLIAEQNGERKAEILKSVAHAMRRIGLERIFFGSDVSGPGHLEPKAAWDQFKRDVPLMENEFIVIAQNVAPYLR